MYWKICKKIIRFIPLLVVAGLLYQHIGTKIDERFYPPPGKLVEVSGCRLHLLYTGTKNGPTIILEAGLGGFSSDFQLVQEEVATFSQVCSYDRAGYGWSEESPYPRTALQIVEELHTLLHKAGIAPPYILVGHSFGGITIRLFANQYPDEVYGLVLVDSSHERQEELLPKEKEPSSFDLSNQKLFYLTAPLGLQRFFLQYERWKAPQDAFYGYYAKTCTNSYFRTVAAESALFEESLKQLSSSKRCFENKPLIVLREGLQTDTPEAEAIWKALQQDLVGQSTQGKEIVAEKSDHMIPWHDPHSIVEAIKEIL